MCDGWSVGHAVDDKYHISCTIILKAGALWRKLLTTTTLLVLSSLGEGGVQEEKGGRGEL